MSRRRFLLAAGGLVALATGGRAQTPARVPIVGFLLTHVPVDDVVVSMLWDGLHIYGYEEGRNVRLVVRSAMGQLDRLPDLMHELVALPIDVLVVLNEVSLRAALEASHTIPIVMNGWTADPVAAGYIQSYRHPGSNVTGVFAMLPSLWGKRLEMVKDLLPGASKVAVLYDSFGRTALPEIEQAARALEVHVESIEFSGSGDIERAFKAAGTAKAKAVLLTFSPTLWQDHRRVAALALKGRLPTVAMFDLFVRAGCLLSYGTQGSLTRSAYFVNRILQGASPSDLPVELVTRPKLTVNLKTAKVLGIKVPDSIRLRADELIR